MMCNICGRQVSSGNSLSMAGEIVCDTCNQPKGVEIISNAKEYLKKIEVREINLNWSYQYQSESVGPLPIPICSVSFEMKLPNGIIFKANHLVGQVHVFEETKEKPRFEP